MITKNFSWLAIGTLAAVCLVSFQTAQPVQATTSITFLDAAGNPAVLDPAAPTYANAADYSNSGLDIGNDGFIFFNWNQSAPTSGVYPNADVVSQNVNNELPAWLSLDFDPTSATYSFGDDAGEEAFAKGGESSWATLTTPEGFGGSGTGLSGALVDPRATDNSNNTISDMPILAGAPSSFLLHVITDNTNLEHDPLNRIRAREDVSGEDSRASNLSFDGSPDVYTFRYDGVVAGDSVKIQLNSGVAGEAPSIAGFMIDVVVPEPTSAALLVLGSLGLISRRRRR
jgi:hypothetical protein